MAETDDTFLMEALSIWKIEANTNIRKMHTPNI